MRLLVAVAGLSTGAAGAMEGLDAREVLAGAPSDLSITVYRAPSRQEGSIDLDDLGGFALVRETRTIRLPAGESRVRFEGVADGIEPVSAIVTGLPEGVIEKNRDARLLSPAALVEAAAGKPVSLVRSNARTGKTERVPGTILSDAHGGVVFQTESAIEALRCSGLSESFEFTSARGLSATPTLSVRVRTGDPVTRTVTLSYLARGFDWAADYTATLSADGTRMDLGAWVTLANGNGVGFPAVHTQVVAGRLNREDAQVEPIDLGTPVLATCWPRGSTSAAPELLEFQREASLAANRDLRRDDMAKAAAAPAALQEAVVTGSRIMQEQLGDLKLYRVAEPTTFASRQSKQVRLLDRFAVPVHRVYGATLEPDSTEEEGYRPAYVLLRTRNDSANHLGLPLPSGRVSLFAPREGAPLLLSEDSMRDLAIDEELEINMGTSPDVQVKAVEEETAIDPAGVRKLPLVPGVLSLRGAEELGSARVEVSNARASEIEFELKLRLEEDMRVVRADHPVFRKDGHAVLRFRVPANRSVAVRFQIARFDTTVETVH
jgi:hypothetical protein